MLKQNINSPIYLAIMFVLATLLSLLAIPAEAAPTASTCQRFHWNPVNTDTDQNAITIDGYVIYYGTSSGNYTDSLDVGDVLEYPITDVLPGGSDADYFIALTARKVTNESSYSNELNIGMRGGVPTKLGIPAVPGSFRLECIITQ